MLKPAEAKQKFMSSLGLLLVIVLWPLLSGIIAGVLSYIGFESLDLITLILAVIWLALFIWFIVMLWKIAPEVGVTPWAFLWIFLPVVGVFLIGMLFLEPLKYIADNKPANERLPLTWDLIKQSWKDFFASLKTTINTSIYYLYIGLALGVSGALVGIWAPWGIGHFLLAIASMLASIWISIKLFYVVWRIDDNKSPKGDEQQLATQQLWPYIGVVLLVALITAGPFLLILLVGGMFALSSLLPLLGGTGAEMTAMIDNLQANMNVLLGGGIVFALLLIASWVWMIYKSVQYSQAIPALLADAKSGYQALKESARIVKNRWWGMLWKNQLWGLIVGAATFALLMAAGLVLAIPLFFLRSTGYAGVANEVLSQALQGGVQMLLMPLTFVFIIKLYKAFKKTAGK
ncbi:hypothetical protein GF391_04365 [Candidatus Uhrbacteria bacterium]|nr:hypothetical protein [Candidatus Uhrbacteria bacterium]